jgi:general secretion pathway protein G
VRPIQPGGPLTSHLFPLTQEGFTLIEILVVITVIAILASIVSPMVFRNVGDAKATAAKAQIELLGLALDTYRLHNDHYPSTGQGLAALVGRPAGDPEARDWRGPYLKQGVPDDPWGRAYHYTSPAATDAEGNDLLSYGRDGQAGGTGEDADVSAGIGRTSSATTGSP